MPNWKVLYIDESGLDNYMYVPAANRMMAYEVAYGILRDSERDCTIVDCYVECE